MKLDEDLICGNPIVCGCPLIDDVKLCTFNIDLENGEMVMLHASEHALNGENGNFHDGTELGFVGMSHDCVTVMIAVR